MAIKIKNKGERQPDEEPEQDSEQPQVPAGNASGSGSGLDGFERAGLRARAWIQDNPRLFLGMVAVAIVAVIGAVVATMHVRGQQLEASDRLSEAFAAYEQHVEGSLELEMLRERAEENPEADVHIPENIFASPEEQWTTIAESADYTLEGFDDGSIAVSAWIARAASALNLEEYEQAEDAYQQVIGADNASEAMEAKALVGLANALAAQGDLEGAQSAWDDYVEIRPHRQAFAEFEMARMVERHGDDPQQAAERYEAFLEEYEDSEEDEVSQFVEEIERRKALL